MTSSHLIRVSVSGVALSWTLAAMAGAATVGDLVARALDANPAISALESGARAMEAGVPAARAWPDPTLSVGIANMGLTEWSVGMEPMAQVGIEVGQMIPIRGTPAASSRVAEAEVVAARAMIASRRNEIAARVGRAAWELYRIDRTIVIESAIRDMFAMMASASEGRVAVGQAPQSALIGMRLEANMAGTKIDEMRNRRPAIVAQLNALLDRPATAMIDSIDPGPVPAASDPARISALVDSALVRQPMLAERRAMVRVAEAQKDLAVRMRIPEPMVNVRYGYRGDLPAMYEAMVGIELPIWYKRRQEPMIRMAGETVLARRGETRTAELETARMVGETVAEMQAAAGALGSFERDLLPQSRQAIDAAYASFSVGRATLIDVLDAVRRWEDMRMEALDQEVMLRLAHVEFLQALGVATTLAAAE